MSRFTINNNGTVLDSTTGLTWQRDVCQDQFTWENAKQFAASLDLAGGGWRLPTLHELFGIVDITRCSPAIDVGAFPRTLNEWFWSSSPYVGTKDSAWLVGFYYGNANGDSITETYHVRCVRRDG